MLIILAYLAALYALCRLFKDFAETGRLPWSQPRYASTAEMRTAAATIGKQRPTGEALLNTAADLIDEIDRDLRDPETLRTDRIVALFICSCFAGGILILLADKGASLDYAWLRAGLESTAPIQILALASAGLVGASTLLAIHLTWDATSTFFGEPQGYDMPLSLIMGLVPIASCLGMVGTRRLIEAAVAIQTLPEAADFTAGFLRGTGVAAAVGIAIIVILKIRSASK